MVSALLLAALALAVGCGNATSPPEGEVSDVLAERITGMVDISRMMETVRFLAGEELAGRATGSPQSAMLEGYLCERLQELGLEPVSPLGLTDFRQSFQVPADRCYLDRETQPGEVVEASNILGMLRGEAEDMIILTANYDGLGRDPQSGEVYPGADYNASGTAAVLEAARVLVSLEEPPGKTLVFALLGGEECGGYGASALAEAIEERGLRERARIINLEGLAAGDGDYMDVWDLNYRPNRETVKALEEAAEILGVTLELGGADPGSSAGTFFMYHVPAVTCDWSWFERSEHPDFHRVTDTPERMNSEGLLKVTRVVTLAAWLLAQG
ncbi:MAG: M20/M25/M40 family metallo-hydrolase [Actinobacteria bacterium]|nr:M20/M25/M40 family metallo-hydrolase [Actinomycetota bacterium]